MRLIALVFTGLLFVLPNTAEAGKKKKGGGDVPTEPGWFQQEGWMGQCYRPPDWSTLQAGAKRVAWQAARDEILAQWWGKRDDGIHFDDALVEAAETAMLSKPERIEDVSQRNLELCMEAMSGKGGGAWQGWAQGLHKELTVGECPSPKMDFKLYDYLSINDDWHIPVNVCRGDKVVVHATDGDYFQLTDGGPWINVAGDASAAVGSELPCNESGCLRGMLLMKYTSTTGQTLVVPVGLETTFLVPDHGRLEVMINDDSLSDNKWKVEKGLEHHTGIEYRPAEN